MIILISPENDLANELETVHLLFEAGLDYYHFRKPAKNKAEHETYLQQLDPQYYNRIVIHNFHELAKDFALKGIHLEEKKWRKKGNDLQAYTQKFSDQGFSVSSSYHEPEDLKAQPIIFDYYLLSPVFGAISKPGYEGRGFDVNDIPKKIVGMGGINTKSTPKALALGFKGVGALGGIWNAEDPVKTFLEMKQQFVN